MLLNVFAALLRPFPFCRLWNCPNFKRQSQLGFASAQVGDHRNRVARFIDTLVRSLITPSHLQVHSEWVQEQPTTLDRLLRSLRLSCQEVMLSRIDELVREALSDHGAVLTELMQLVVPRELPRLQWGRLDVEGATACFEAVCGADLFSINLLTGLLLVNGVPPGRLPTDILEHPLYRRVFADCNPETCVLSDGTLQTVRPIHGCVYSFQLREAQLVVHERDAAPGQTLRLLDGAPSGIADWGRDLPPRLRELHSHWLSADHSAVLLRGRPFHQRGVAFVAVRRADTEWECLHVPSHCRDMRWTELLMPGRQVDWDRLVIPREPCVAGTVLAKFEPRQYHHFCMAPCGRVKVALPRYALEFRLEPAQEGAAFHFRSLNYVGYRLADVQALEDTLFGFQHYLVLEHVRTGREMLLCPKGLLDLTVAPELGRSIALPPECDAVCQCQVYDVHPRFRHLKARSVGARLQLATLYAATGSLLPEPRLHMTGGECAMELVRQSWGNCPLEAEAGAQLRHMAEEFGHRYPGLVLLCHELEESSRQLGFLYAEAEAGSTVCRSIDDRYMPYSLPRAHPMNFSRPTAWRILTHSPSAKSSTSKVFAFD